MFFSGNCYRIPGVRRCVGMVDEADSKSVASDGVWVRVPPPAPETAGAFAPAVSGMWMKDSNGSGSEWGAGGAPEPRPGLRRSAGRVPPPAPEKGKSVRISPFLVARQGRALIRCAQNRREGHTLPSRALLMRIRSMIVPAYLALLRKGAFAPAVSGMWMKDSNGSGRIWKEAEAGASASFRFGSLRSIGRLIFYECFDSKTDRIIGKKKFAVVDGSVYPERRLIIEGFMFFIFIWRIMK